MSQFKATKPSFSHRFDSEQMRSFGEFTDIVGGKIERIKSLVVLMENYVCDDLCLTPAFSALLDEIKDVNGILLAFREIEESQAVNEVQS